MSETPTQETLTPPTSSLPPILSLAQLNEACRKKMRVEIEFCGTRYAAECYRLTPAQDAALAEITEIVSPPMTRGKTMEDDRPDFSNPKFLKEKMKAEEQARALGLYWCVPALKEPKPDLADPKAILEFVQGQLNEKILQCLWTAIKQGGVKLAELVNFT
jgi:hypothetical protein